MSRQEQRITDPIIEAASTTIQRAAMEGGARPVVTSFFDPATSSVSHVLHDPVSRAAIVVDPVLDYDPASGRTSHASINVLVDHVRNHGLAVEWILDTHVHADHLSAAAVLRDRFRARVGMSRHVRAVHDRFADLFDRRDEPLRATAFDRLFDDGDVFAMGYVECMALHVPGHTPADMAFVVGDVVLTGDTLFMPDFGTARADFPGGDVGKLFRSVRRLLSLPDETRLSHCHDYPPPERGTPAWTSTVGQQRENNIHVRDGVSEADFVAMRSARDATLATPALMMASVQVNVRGGELPAPAPNGRRYLKLPLDAI